MRGRGGSFRGNGKGVNSNMKVQNRGVIKNNRGRMRTNISVRGRGGKVVTDARMKIIEKNRLKMTDARDRLADIAKQSDARLKLEKLRALQLKKEIPALGISRKTGKNGRITLSTNKNVVPHNKGVRQSYPPQLGISYEPPVIPMETGYNDLDYLDPQILRRTVNNEYAPTPPPPPPIFQIKSTSPYTWKRPNAFAEDWSFTPKARPASSNTLDNKFFSTKTHRDVHVKSRLDSMPNKIGAMSAMGRPKSSSASNASGFRIVVSNLQPNVTQEDIKELFEDVGDLMVSRLIRPGIAEVVYRTLKDAMKAVDTYHNRQLDGHPMKCLLVNPTPKSSPSVSSVRSLNDRRRGNSSYVEPILGAVHRALFDD